MYFSLHLFYFNRLFFQSFGADLPKRVKDPEYVRKIVVCNFETKPESEGQKLYSIEIIENVYLGYSKPNVLGSEFAIAKILDEETETIIVIRSKRIQKRI